MARLTWDEIEEEFQESISYGIALENYAEYEGYELCDNCGYYSDESKDDLCPVCYEERQKDDEEAKRAQEKGLGHIEIDARQMMLEVV